MKRFSLNKVIAILMAAFITFSVMPVYTYAIDDDDDYSTYEEMYEWYQSVKPIDKSTLTSTQKKAVKVVDTYMKAAKKYDWKKMNKCFYKLSKKYGYPTNKRFAKYHKKYNKSIKWKIISAKGTGRVIKIKVAYIHPDLYKPYYSASYKIMWWTADHKSANTKKIGQQFAKIALKKLKKAKVGTEIDSATFTIVKVNGKWRIKKKTAKLTDIAAGNYNAAEIDSLDAFVEDYVEINS